MKKRIKKRFLEWRVKFDLHEADRLSARAVCLARACPPGDDETLDVVLDLSAEAAWHLDRAKRTIIQLRWHYA